VLLGKQQFVQGPACVFHLRQQRLHQRLHVSAVGCSSSNNSTSSFWVLCADSTQVFDLVWCLLLCYAGICSCSWCRLEPALVLQQQVMYAFSACDEENSRSQDTVQVSSYCYTSMQSLLCIASSLPAQALMHAVLQIVDVSTLSVTQHDMCG
jgi:hypothetical protein